MSKFKKKTSTSQDIPTAALPDIIFMLLFFFMVTTVLRETDMLVEQHLPRAEQLTKLARKSLISYLYMGKPKNIEFGSEPRIQANDKFIGVEDVVLFVAGEKDKLDEAERDMIRISLKVDEDVKMGVLSDVQQELREANALAVMYNTPPRGADE